MELDPIDNPLLFYLLIIIGIICLGYSLVSKNKILMSIGIILLLFCCFIYFEKYILGKENIF